MGIFYRLTRLTVIRKVKQRLKPIIDLDSMAVGIREYWRFRRDWRTYAQMPGSEPLLPENAYPCLYDRTSSHPLDAHYFYQDVWAFKAIQTSGVARHVDVGSRDILVGMLTAITHTTFVDIRPLHVTLDNFESRPGSILSLPFQDNRVISLSCLHVAEHIGLGRYGDPLDPLGTEKACKELSRVLAPGGNLYFSLPIGVPRVCFNAHRIHSPLRILELFAGLSLAHFSAVDDKGHFNPNGDPAEFINASYACGLFHFVKPGS